MKEIKLSQQGKNKGKYVALVDDEDFEYLNQWRWKVGYYKNGYRADRTISKCKGGGSIYMHRVIMKTPEELDVDHKDHNGLNNQKSNLRNCTRSQNNMNKSTWSSSGYLGSHHHNNGHYKSAIRVNNKLIYLGYFNSKEAAALCYDKAAIKYHGEFANPNFKTNN